MIAIAKAVGLSTPRRYQTREDGRRGVDAILLVAWVAAIAVIRGVNNIVLAFRVREVQHPASV